MTANDYRDQLRQQVDDLSALKKAMHHRRTLQRFSPEWDDALKLEDGLIARIKAWPHPIGRNQE